jgi:hypothetical protein
VQRRAQFFSHFFYRTASLLVLGGCASGVSFDWPGTNPFEKYQKVNFEDYSASGLSKLDLVFSANVFGETDPCGCASGPKGGLDRRLNFLQMTPVFGDRLVLEAGNALFSVESLDPSRLEFLKRRAVALLQGAQTMGVRAFNLGYLDLGAGTEFLKSQGKKFKTPFVSASIVSESGNPEAWYSPFIDLQVASMTVRVTGLTAGRKEMPSGFKTIDADLALKRVVSEGSSPDFLVILSDLGRIEDERLLAKDFGMPTVVVGSRDLSSLDRPIVRGDRILVQPQFRGQQWGRLRVLTAPKAHAWFNLGQSAEFYKRWNEIHSKYAEIEQRQSGSERSSELKNQISAAQELLGQGPGNEGDRRSVFSYELVELGSKFMKSNELSKVMKDVSE